MALPLPPGLTQAEVAFVAEMELVTIVPRQRLESIHLLGVRPPPPPPKPTTNPHLQGKTPALRPPHRAELPLWLALLLKKQRRANIVCPPWLYPASLATVIHRETKEDPAAFSPPPPPPSRAHPGAPGLARRVAESEAGMSAPFVPSCTADAPAGYLPYHWLEVAEALLAHAGDDMPVSAGEIRSLLRDLVEVRAAKMRSSAATLEGLGGGLTLLRGVGSMELAESRGFVLEVVDGVRKIGASLEANRRERDEMRGEGGGDDESDDDMGL